MIRFDLYKTQATQGMIQNKFIGAKCIFGFKLFSKKS